MGLLVLDGHLWGCDAAAARRRELTSSNALDRARAVQKVAASGELSLVPDLVGVLDDPDQAVRMYAQMALRRLTGEDLGYRYYAGDDERAAAIARWREALRRGGLSPTSAPALGPGSVLAPGAEESEGPGLRSQISGRRPSSSDAESPGADISGLPARVEER